MKAHLCIGGPLDGEFAWRGDFYGSYEKVSGTQRNDYSKRVEGMYAHLKHEYDQFNTGSHRNGACNVVWLHRSVQKPSISVKKR